MEISHIFPAVRIRNNSNRILLSSKKKYRIRTRTLSKATKLVQILSPHGDQIIYPLLQMQDPDSVKKIPDPDPNHCAFHEYFFSPPDIIYSELFLLCFPSNFPLLQFSNFEEIRLTTVFVTIITLSPLHREFFLYPAFYRVETKYALKT